MSHLPERHYDPRIDLSRVLIDQPTTFLNYTLVLSLVPKLFFYMKSSKAYHIAYKYQKKGRLDPLLTNDILETRKHKASDSETLLNIFNDN